MQEAYATSLPAVIRGEEAFQAARRQRRNAALLGAAVVLVCLIVAAWVSEAHPATLWAGLPRIFEYFIRILPDLRWVAVFADAETEGSIAFWFYRLPEWALLIVETANMAALATLLGSAVSLLLAFPAARNISPSGFVYQITRRFLEALRTIPEIVYALIFVWAFGVGALAGILAMRRAMSTITLSSNARYNSTMGAARASNWSSVSISPQAGTCPASLPGLRQCGRRPRRAAR
jgi:phosphonate transport system permease protein